MFSDSRGHQSTWKKLDRHKDNILQTPHRNVRTRLEPLQSHSAWIITQFCPSPHCPAHEDYLMNNPIDANCRFTPRCYSHTDCRSRCVMSDGLESIVSCYHRHLRQFPLNPWACGSSRKSRSISSLCCRFFGAIKTIVSCWEAVCADGTILQFADSPLLRSVENLRFAFYFLQ